MLAPLCLDHATRKRLYAEVASVVSFQKHYKFHSEIHIDHKNKLTLLKQYKYLSSKSPIYIAWRDTD
eukprot:4736298-Amphidinium_carterae.2